MNNRKRSIRKQSGIRFSAGQIALFLFGFLFLCAVLVIAFKEFRQRDRVDTLQRDYEIAQEELMAEKNERITALRNEAELRVNSIDAIQSILQADMDLVNSKYNDYQQALAGGDEAGIASARSAFSNALSALSADIANNKDILLRAMGDVDTQGDE